MVKLYQPLKQALLFVFRNKVYIAIDTKDPEIDFVTKITLIGNSATFELDTNLAKAKGADTSGLFCL